MFYYLLHKLFIFEIRFSLKCIPTLVFRIFMYAKNDFNHIKEDFLDYQRRNNSSVSPNWAIGCTCPFTGFSQPSCPQLSTCPLPLGKGNQIFHLVRFYFYLIYFITVIIIIFIFGFLILTLLHILRTVWTFF